jgi:hypothetical protein
MTCQQCIALATEFVEELMSPADAVRFQNHIAQCASCARYQRVLAKGLTLVHQVPDVEPSSDFVLQLHRRLRAVDDEMLARQRSVTSGVTVALALAGLVAFAAWSPLLIRDESPSIVTASEPVRQNGDAGAAMTISDVWTPEVGDYWLGMWMESGDPLQLPDLQTSIPGPYSPLIVQPPDPSARRRTVLAAFGSE